MAPASAVVRCRGHRFLRQRLVLSLLSGRPVRIDGIRAQEDEPGLRGAGAARTAASEATV